MKRTILFLQLGIVWLGIVVVILLLWEPHLEGRNVNATFFEIYFNDAFLAYVYIASIPFFIAHYQGFRLLQFLYHKQEENKKKIKSALQIIKKCTLCIIGFGIVGEIGILLQRGEDCAGGFVLGLFVIFSTITMLVIINKIIINKSIK